MRLHLFGAVLLATLAAPVAAQRDEPVERRIQRLEQEMRAVQRRVFPGGRTQFVEPEIEPQPGLTPQAGLSGNALSSLTGRVDALEAQLRSLTGQIEEQEYRGRQLEEQITRLREELQGRLDRIEQQGRQPAAAPTPAAGPQEPEPREDRDEPAPEPRDEPGDAPSSGAAGDEAQEAYNAGFRLWNSGRYAEAQRTLNAAATRFPNSRWASWARNLEGRAYLDDDKPASAARVFLANYQENPRGERAADSLYFLGVSLTRLNRRTEACRVYDELQQVYPNMRDFVRERLPRARSDAGCASR
jgi:TolA-binding protein